MILYCVSVNNKYIGLGAESKAIEKQLTLALFCLKICQNSKEYLDKY